MGQRVDALFGMGMPDHVPSGSQLDESINSGILSTHEPINGLRTERNGWRCADDIFKRISLSENWYILWKWSLFLGDEFARSNH